MQTRETIVVHLSGFNQTTDLPHWSECCNEYTTVVRLTVRAYGHFTWSS